MSLYNKVVEYGKTFLYSSIIASQLLLPSMSGADTKIEILKNTPLKNELRKLKYLNGDPVFGVFYKGEIISNNIHLNMYVDDLHGDFNYAKYLSQFMDKDDEPIFNSEEIIDLWKLKTPLSYANSMAIQRREDGMPLNYGKDIKNLYEDGITVKQLKKYSRVRSDKGKNWFRSGTQIANYLTVTEDLFNIDDPFGFAKTVADIKKDGHGFIYGSQLTTMVERYESVDKTLEAIHNYKQFTDVFDSDLEKFVDEGGKFLFAKSLFQLGFDNKSVMMFNKLGYDSYLDVFFNDTDKPNAVVVFTHKDEEGAFENRSSIEKLLILDDYYDLFFRIAKIEDDLYYAIMQVPNIETLFIGGHGNKTNLSFGDADPGVSKLEKSEKYSLDTGDEELGKYLAMLDEAARIFQFSCANAKGGENADNLANFVKEQADERIVFASRGPFSAGNIVFESIYPLVIKVLGPIDENREDVDLTYTNLSD